MVAVRNIMSRPSDPDLGHIGRHDPIALLGHGRRLRARPFRTGAEIEKTNPERRGDALQRGKMRVAFGPGRVNVAQRRAGQFELPARLQRNRAAALGVVKPDQGVAVEDRRPALRRLQTLDQRANAAGLIGNGRVVRLVKRDFFVFRSDAQGTSRGFDAGLDPGDEFAPRRNRRCVVSVASHSSLSCQSAVGRSAHAPKGQASRLPQKPPARKPTQFSRQTA